MSNKNSILDSQDLFPKYDIIFIQETKISRPEILDFFTKIYKNYIVYHSYSLGNSGGLITMIKKNQNYKITNAIITHKYIAIQISINKRNFNLVNIYCPNYPAERADLLKEIDYLFLNNGETILGGDFNFVPNIKIDKKGGNAKKGDKGQALMQILCDDFNLIDFWRFKNPNT